MIAALIGPLTNLVGSWMDQKTEVQRSKASVARVRAEAESAVLVSSATSQAEWEKLMAQGSQNSIKDEILTILFSIPLVLAFCGEWGRTVTEQGFLALEACPDWYKAALGTIISASFATKQATKFFGARK